MVKIVRLVTRSERTKQQAAATARDQLKAFLDEAGEDLTPARRLATSKAIHALHAHASPAPAGGIWPGGFVMLSRKATEHVWEKIRHLDPSKRPVQVRDVFMLLMLNLEQDTGVCELTRDEIAQRIGCTPNHISRIISTLESWGVVRRELVKIEGMRGRGVVSYVVNPEAAWNGLLDGRKPAVEAGGFPPLLTLMQGGVSADPE